MKINLNLVSILLICILFLRNLKLLFLLQELAEYAARSKTPLVLVTVLHTAFSEYAQRSDTTRRSEWQKVQGRFTDIAFREPTNVLNDVPLRLRPVVPELMFATVSSMRSTALASAPT